MIPKRRRLICPLCQDPGAGRNSSGSISHVVDDLSNATVHVHLVDSYDPRAAPPDPSATSGEELKPAFRPSGHPLSTRHDPVRVRRLAFGAQRLASSAMKGIASLVLEKSETLRADGVAIGVHANGWRVLEQLGLAAELRETANLITAYHDVWQQRNNKTSQLPIRLVQQVWQRRNKTSQLPIRKELRNLKRKDLIETMAKNLPSGAIRFGCHVVAIHQDHGTHGAILTTVDGCTIKAKVLIGCDGANSVVAKYLGLYAPKTIHRTVFRGFTRYPHGHPFSTEFLRLKGEEFFVGRIPITHNLVQFLVITPIPPTGRITKDVIATKDSVVEKLRAEDCPSDVIEMLRNSDPETLNVVNNIWYRPPWQVAFGTFHKGVVTVAGDAMHVMGPFIGQGGSSGLEDAVVLARSLSRAAGGDYSVAIEEYVRERRPRVALVSLESFVFGMLGSAKSLVTKLACIVFLALLGNRSFRHANYDCGRL